MHQYKILPIDQSYSSAQVTALDAGAVLNVIGQLQCGEADVLQDDAYVFSIRLGVNGMWSIFQRDYAGEHAQVSSFG